MFFKKYFNLINPHMNKALRIGTRDSALAMWQAHRLQNLLLDRNIESTLIPIKSLGDLNLEEPLYAMGTVGIFTKTLDQALLAGKIDVAIHSMKDVPTSLPIGLKKAAVLERGVSGDVVVWKNNESAARAKRVIATGSLRRQAQWQYQWPNDELVSLRGNIHTRLQKLRENDWDGAIFAAAALERLSIENECVAPLAQFIPAPAQGALLVVARGEDTDLLQQLSVLNHTSTDLCTQIERDFLRTLEGGCAAPIGAKAELIGQTLSFKGALYSLRGSSPVIIEKTMDADKASGVDFAQEVLEAGGKALLEEFKN